MNSLDMAVSTDPHIIVMSDSPEGASRHAYTHLTSHLSKGKQAVVFDCGTAYRSLVKSLGGTLVQVGPDNSSTSEVYGSCPLIVYELHVLMNKNAKASIPSLPFLPKPSADQLIMVKELWMVSFLCEGLWAWVQQSLSLKAKLYGGVSSLAGLDQSAIPCNVKVMKLGSKAEPVCSDAPLYASAA